MGETKIAGCEGWTAGDSGERSCKLDWSRNKKEIHLAIEKEGFRRSEGRLHRKETLSLMPLLHITDRACYPTYLRNVRCIATISVCCTIKSAIDMKLFRHNMAKYMAIVFIASNIFSWRVFHKIQTSLKSWIFRKQKTSYLHRKKIFLVYI